VTLLAGAWIGCAKDDIKKALAGSTMSQIGYMMLAAGLGPAGYAFAIFHLLTHGFFKANLFLGAGSVMHGMDDDVDMRHYGAVRAAMPVTFVTFALGYLAIIGVPPFAGFWSKDKIIETALAQSWWAGIGALLGAGVTAFYMTRLFAMTFLGQKRWLDDVHPHESPRVMTLPLVALGALSAFGGALAIGGWITDWLAPVTGEAPEHALPAPAWAISIVVLAVVALGILLGLRMYAARAIPGQTPADQDVSIFSRAGREELYGNAVNDALAVRPTRHLVRTLVYLDGAGLDGFVTGVADRLGDAANALRRQQNGFVRSYALSMVTGALVVLAVLLAVTLP
jgi:NADH-quinone oxidoreductase subunit L